MTDMQERVEAVIHELTSEGRMTVNEARFILNAIRKETNSRPEIVINPIDTVRDCDD